MKRPDPVTVDSVLLGALGACLLYAAGCLVLLAWSLRSAFDEDSWRRP